MELTPSRRSRRLLRNGYYSLAPGEIAKLEQNSSEDDDNSSIHSNSSMYSERSIKYRESPRLSTKKRRCKRGVDKPSKLITSTLEQSDIQQTVEFAQRKHSTKVQLTASASAVFRQSPSPYSITVSQSKKFESDRDVTKSLCLSAGDGVAATSKDNLINESHISAVSRVFVRH